MATETSAPPAYCDRWEQAWGAGLERGAMWDIAGSAKPLLQALGDANLLGCVAGKTCFVPGCGRGYDVITFAKHGASRSVGLELAQSAVAAAEEEVQARVADGTLTSQQAEDVVQLVAGDFLTWKADRDVDIGYDYTFACAIHPSMRKDWAKSWARHLRRADGTGGRLVTLIFPVDPARDPNVGPPFPLTPELIKSLLEPEGFRLDYLEPVAPSLSIPKRQGKEFLAIWTLI